MRFLIANNRSDLVLGELPLKSTTGYGWAIQSFTTQSFTLDPKDAACPANWLELIESGANYIVPLRSGYDPSGYLQGFYITGWQEAADGTIRIAASSWERCYENTVTGGMRFDLKDSASVVFPAVAGVVNEDGKGPAMTFDCPPSGKKINKYIDAYERLTPAEVMKEVANEFEYTVDILWADESHTKFRKVTRTRAPHLSPATTEPLIAFTRDINGRGNIESYTYTDSRREDEYATYVVATGSGVDDAQIESAPKIDNEQEVGHMRVKKYENFPGVTTIAEANIMAQRMADRYFVKKNVITLRVRSDGAVPPERIAKGQFALLDLYTKAGVRVREVWRVIALRESTDGRTYEPTLAKIGTNPSDFPRPRDVSDIGREIDDVRRRVERGINRNPSRNGVRMNNARINDDGSIERRNPDGSYSPATRGYMWMGTVQSTPANTKAPVSVLVEGEGAQQCKNWTGEKFVLNMGDKVLVSKDADTGEYVVFKRVSGAVNVMDNGEYLVIDPDNSSGLGTGSLLQLHKAGSIAVYPKGGAKVIINKPSAVQDWWPYVGTQVFGGSIYQWWRTALNSDELKLYWYDQWAKAWTEVVLPSGDLLPANSVGEVFSAPALVTVSNIVEVVDEDVPWPGADTSHITFDATVHSMDSSRVWWGKAYQMQTTAKAGRKMTGNTYPSPHFSFGYIYNSRHLLLEVYCAAEYGDPPVYLGVHHIDRASETDTLIQDEGDLLYSYLGNEEQKPTGQGLTYGYSDETRLLRLSDTCTLYKGYAISSGSNPQRTVPGLYYRRLGQTTTKVPLTFGFNSSGNSVRVQQDADTHIFYVSVVYSETAGGDSRVALWRIEGGATTTLVPRYTGTLDDDAVGAAQPAHPLQNLDGTITAVIFDPEIQAPAPLMFERH